MTTQRSSDEFVSRMTAHSAASPAIKAALRSGLGKPVERCGAAMHEQVASWVGPVRPDDRRDAHRERCFFTIASLIAHTPEGAVPSTSPGNLGATMALATRRGVLARSTSARLVERVGKHPAESVCRGLVHVVVTLRSSRVPVSFTTLLDDLLAWSYSQNQVRKNWLQSYYTGIDEG